MYSPLRSGYWKHCAHKDKAMKYQSMSTTDRTRFLRQTSLVDAAIEGGNGARITELSGSRLGEKNTPQNSRKRAAFALLVLAVGMISAYFAMGGQPSPPSEFKLVSFWRVAAAARTRRREQCIDRSHVPLCWVSFSLPLRHLSPLVYSWNPTRAGI